MFFMFTTFAFGIILELIIVLPIFYIIEILKGPNPSRMQNTHRFFFSIWIFLMKTGRLLECTSITGTPHEGPCIIIANHPGLFDVIYLIWHIPKFSVMVKKTLTTKLPLGPIFNSSGYVISPDKKTENPVPSLKYAINILERGYKFLIFPEGTRSPAGSLNKFKAGSLKIAQKVNLPIQPVLIHNAPPFLPKGAPWFLPPRKISHLKIEFLEPIPAPKTNEVRSTAIKIEKLFREKLGIKDT